METGNRIYFFYIEKCTSYVGEIKEKDAIIPLYIFIFQNMLKIYIWANSQILEQVPFL